MRPFPLLSCLLVAGLILSGCASYEPLSREGGSTRLAVLPVVNEAPIPQIIAPLSRNVRERIAHSPNWELSAPEAAQASLQITVLGIERRAMARDPEDTGRPLSFREVVRISLEWDGDSPPPWGEENPVYLETDMILYAQPSLVDAQTVSMAEVADRLAEKVIRQLDWIE